jgi:hypothetical protein
MIRKITFNVVDGTTSGRPVVVMDAWLGVYYWYIGLPEIKDCPPPMVQGDSKLLDLTREYCMLHIDRPPEWVGASDESECLSLLVWLQDHGQIQELNILH